MAGMMDKPLDGAGLAVVNQVINERLEKMTGTPGKSAYQYAQDGGYTGTEAEFQTLLAGAASKTYVDDAVADALGAVETALSEV